MSREKGPTAFPGMHWKSTVQYSSSKKIKTTCLKEVCIWCIPHLLFIHCDITIFFFRIIIIIIYLLYLNILFVYYYCYYIHWKIAQVNPLRIFSILYLKVVVYNLKGNPVFLVIGDRRTDSSAPKSHVRYLSPGKSRDLN